MIKINLTNILVAVAITLLVLVLIKDDKTYDLVDVNLEQSTEIVELRSFNNELLTENHNLKVERIQRDILENDVKKFYDSSYVDLHTDDAVKDSALSNFFRQYDMLVGQRLREGGKRIDSTSRD